jgi:nitronate monooxygenase
MTIEALRSRLTLPVIAAPMFLVSGPDLVIACCKAGVMGSFPTANARTAEECASWLERIDAELSSVADAAPYAVNIIVRSAGTSRFEADLALIDQHRPAVVITSVGSPAAVVPRVKAYGGLVFHDVATMRHAEKAIEAGVDGLILLTAGAGGHTGTANPFAFVPQIRRIFDGAILLAGGISDGRGVRAAEVLGADFAYMGTRFAATRESLASARYRDLLVSQHMADVVTTDRISGLKATFLRGSIAAAGLDPDALPPVAARFKPDLPDTIKAWRDVWSAGHGVGLIDDIPPVAELVARLKQEYHAAASKGNSR